MFRQQVKVAVLVNNLDRVIGIVAGDPADAFTVGRRYRDGSVAFGRAEIRIEEGLSKLSQSVDK